MHKTLILLCLLFICARAGAQDFILSGSITDKKGKPVKEANLQVVSGDKMLLCTSNTDGLYETKVLPAGKYEVVISVNKKTYVSKVEILATDPLKRFYNFRLNDNNTATLTKTDKDPFMETAFIKLRKQKGGYDIDNRKGKILLYKKDSVHNKQKITY